MSISAEQLERKVTMIDNFLYHNNTTWLYK